MPLPEPQGRQREVLYLPARGHVVVLGTAGSGKTTLAIHRAAWLYVGVTRARSSLILTHSGPLTSLLPSDPGLVDSLSL